jgi:hypothetical protein
MSSLKELWGYLVLLVLLVLMIPVQRAMQLWRWIKRKVSKAN